MKSKIFFLKIILVITTMLLSINCFGAINSVIADLNVGLFEKYEIDFQLSKSYTNPYNPDEIDVYAIFTAPSGKQYKVNGFYYKGVYDSDLSNDIETPDLEYTGSSSWKIRFSPNETGSWRFNIYAKDKQGTSQYPTSYYQTFNCTSTNEKGFIKLANSRYFKYDNGEPYYPIGTNCPYDKYPGATWDGKGTIIMKEFINKMSAEGLNYFRIGIDYYLAFSIWGFDHTKDKSYYKYMNQYDSWQLDEIVDYAKSKDVNLVLYFFEHTNYGDYDPCNNQWTQVNPSNKNVVNFNPENTGDAKGTLLTPYDFFINEENINQQLKYIRYAYSRWGYATNIFAFELINEARNMGGKTADPEPSDFDDRIIDWHQTVIPEIRNMDPMKHLLTTSWAGAFNPGETEIYPLLDLTQAHEYFNYPYSVPQQNILYDHAQDYYSDYQKPFLVGEYAYLNGWRYPVTDPYVYDLHNSLWALLFSGAQPSPSFWTFQHLDTYGALFNYNGISNFIKKLPQFDNYFIPKYENKNGFRIYSLTDNIENRIFGWIQDDNFNMKKIFDSDTTYLQDLTSNRPSYQSASYNYRVKIDVPIESEYELKWYNTNTGELYKEENKTTSNGEVELYHWYALRNGNYADGAFILSCKPSIGWVEKQTCHDQWNNVRTDSELETNTSGSHIFYINSNNKVCALYKNGSSWGDAVLNNDRTLNGRGLVFNPLDDDIYYLGDDYKIYKLYYYYGNWYSIKVCSGQWNNVRSDSELETNTSGSHILYINSNNKVCALYKNGSSWEDAILNNDRTISGRGLVFNPLDDDIYYVGDDHKIYKLHYYYGNWNSTKVCSGQWNNVRSDSELEINLSGSNVYYINSDNLICVLYKNGGSWGDGILNSSMTEVKGGTNFTVDKSTGQIYYIGEDNYIYNLYYSGGWQWRIIHQIGYCQDNAVSGMTFINSALYYTGSDSKIHDFNYIQPSKSSSLNEKSTLIEESLSNFIIYPNPVSSQEEITIKVSDIYINSNISIYNIKGELIYSSIINSNYNILNISNYDKGFYLLQIIGPNINESKKLIIL